MYDVLIIGSGASGLTAALNANKEGAKVAIISKTYPTHSQTVQAQGGINAVLYEDKDSVEEHIKDTYNASKELALKENIKYMCQNAKDTIQWLDDIGVPFNRDSKNNFSQRKFGGTKKIRTCYSSDYTGLKIVHTLYDQCIKDDIKTINENILLNLIIEDNKCIGVTALDIQSGNIKEYISKTVILATGGYSGIYTNFTTNSYSNTGDGIAVALRAGAKLSNMEFVQFHPTALENTNILISESARGEGGYLVDENENRFIDELKPRDEVARAIYEKIELGQKVYLDLRHLGKEKIESLMPQERRLAYEFSNVKLEDELLPINPAAHYSMGGIKTDKEAQTSITNLFACGECAQANIHGANRLGGNSLLEIVSFGKVAGSNAAKASLKDKGFDINNTQQLKEDKNFISNLFESSNEINFYEKKDLLGKLFFKDVGLFRTNDKLDIALTQISQIKNDLSKMGIGDKSKIYNKNLVELIEFWNMIEVSEIIASCAKNRCESRGSHFRSDYPTQEDSFIKNSTAYKIENNLIFDFEEVL